MDSDFKGIVLLIILFYFLTPSLTGAQKIPNPLKAESFEELIENLIDFTFWVAVAIAPIMIIVAGVYFLTSAGNPDKVRTAKSIIFWTIVGFAIVLLAKGIISMVREVIGG